LVGGHLFGINKGLGLLKTSLARGYLKGGTQGIFHFNLEGPSKKEGFGGPFPNG